MRQPRAFPALALAVSLTVTVALAAAPASAACLVEFKAKRDDPYGLDRGVMEIPDEACNQGDAAAIVAQRLAAEGWTLLSIVGVSGAGGDAQGNAGD
jgi:hypothetical protein